MHNFALAHQQIQNILKTSLKNGGDWAEIFLEHTSHNGLLAEDNKIEKISSGIIQGAGLRIIKLPHTYYASTTDYNYENLLKLAKELATALSQNTKDISLSQNIAKSINASPQADIIYKQFPENIPLVKKINKILLANAVAQKIDPRIKQITIGYRDTTQDVLIVNSEGLFIQDQRIRTRFTTQVIAQEKEILQTGYEGPGALEGFEFFEHNLPEEIATEAAERALLMLEAKPAPSGTMQVVLAGEAGGTLIHEACGHAFEGDFIYKKTSVFHDKLGQQILSPLITIVDDGSIPGHFGTGRYDDEGTPSQKNVLVEKGKIIKFMQDRVHASLLNMPLTGNGRRESFQNRAIPRMTNTYIAPGQHDPNEIIASIKDGLFVRKMGGGQVDITSGDFVFEVTESFLIKNGRISHPVRGATLVGNGPKILASVDMVGNDLFFIPGVCGKGDHAPVTDGQPTLRIPEIVVGGIS
ncbi:MAG: TldD/PmbA family protein [Candidatus Margulisbacteria bacterium]|nr:TldD/PmbA family protein [Candidatus Margulisiibacteriota bacterium]